MVLAEREIELMRAEFGETLANLDADLPQEEDEASDSELDLDNLSSAASEGPSATTGTLAEESSFLPLAMASSLYEEDSAPPEDPEVERLQREAEDEAWFFSSRRRAPLNSLDAESRAAQLQERRSAGPSASSSPTASSLLRPSSSALSETSSDGAPVDYDAVARWQREQAELRAFQALSRDWDTDVEAVEARDSFIRKLNLNAQISQQRRWLSLREYEDAPGDDSALKSELRRWFTELDTEESGTVPVDALITPMLQCGVVPKYADGTAFVRQALKRSVTGLTFHLFCELVTYKPEGRQNPITELHQRLTQGRPAERLLTLECLVTQYRRRLLLHGLTSHAAESQPAWFSEPLSPREARQVPAAVAYAEEQAWQNAYHQDGRAAPRGDEAGGGGGGGGGGGDGEAEQPSADLERGQVAGRLEQQAARIARRIRRRLEAQDRHCFKAEDFNVMRARRSNGSIASLLGAENLASTRMRGRRRGGGRRARRKAAAAAKQKKPKSKRTINVHTYAPGEEVPHRTRIRVSKSEPALPHIVSRNREPQLSVSQKIIDSRRESLGLSYKISSLVKKDTIPVPLHAAVGMAHGQWGYLAEKQQREERRRSRFTVDDLPK